MAEVDVQAVIVETWWRRQEGRTVESVRLVWRKDVARWEVHRTGHEPAGHANRSLALLAIRRLIGEAWVHEPRPQRRPVSR